MYSVPRVFFSRACRHLIYQKQPKSCEKKHNFNCPERRWSLLLSINVGETTENPLSLTILHKGMEE